MQQTGAGILPVEIRFKDGRPQRVTMTQKQASFKPSRIKKQKLAEALGLKAGDLSSRTRAGICLYWNFQFDGAAAESCRPVKNSNEYG